MSSGTATANRHVRYLDGLRGLAILMVVMVHVSQLAPDMPGRLRDLTFYGVRGVQLFFVVSGLTLTLSHFSRPLELPNFYARRFFRIAPMFYLGAIVYPLLGLLTDLPFAPKAVTPGEMAMTLGFVHDWSLTANNKVVPGGWSIGCEAMFYLAFPLLLFALRRFGVRFWPLLAGTYVIAGVTNIALRHLPHVDPALAQGFAFSFWLCQLPAFATGCWLALGAGQNRLSPRAAGWIMAGVAVLILIDTQLRGRSNLLVAIVLLSALVWAAGRARPAWLEGRVIPFLGEVSFSLYLLHFLIVALLSLVAPAAITVLGPTVTFLLAYLVTLAIGVPLAAFTYRYVEQPFIRIGRGLFREPAAART